MSVSVIHQPVSRAMELRLIRDFEVRCRGEPVAVPTASQRLVTFLAFQPRPVRRTCVSGTLWFDADERHASASLRSALWRLHPLDLVCASNSHVWLNPGVEVDLHRVIGRALAVLRATPGDEVMIAIARDLVDAGDDILNGWYEDWVTLERERFRQLRLHAMDRIGEWLVETGRWYDALQVGLAATGSEPLRESAHRLLVRVHLRQGNIAEAIRQYRLYAERLRSELNGRPSAEIRALVAPYLCVSPA